MRYIIRQDVDLYPHGLLPHQIASVLEYVLFIERRTFVTPEDVDMCCPDRGIPIDINYNNLNDFLSVVDSAIGDCHSDILKVHYDEGTWIIIEEDVRCPLAMEWESIVRENIYLGISLTNTLGY